MIPLFRTLIMHHDAPKIGTNDMTFQYKLRHFQTSENPKSADLLHVIYRLMYLSFKIREIYPVSSLANHINKLVHLHKFVYLICTSLGKHFPFFFKKIKMDYSLFIFAGLKLRPLSLRSVTAPKCFEANMHGSCITAHQMPC